HSYFTVSSVIPPVVQFTSVGHKDSLRNAQATGEFVVSVCTEAMTRQVDDSAVPSPPDMSVFDMAWLTPEASARVAPPRLAESPTTAPRGVVVGADRTPLSASPPPCDPPSWTPLATAKIHQTPPRAGGDVKQSDRAAATRNAILTAAQEVFTTAGFSDANIAD